MARERGMTCWDAQEDLNTILRWCDICVGRTELVIRPDGRGFTAKLRLSEEQVFRLQEGLGLRNVTEALDESRRIDDLRAYALDEACSPFEVESGRAFVELNIKFQAVDGSLCMEAIYARDR